MREKRTIIARTKQYLKESQCVKVEVEELEDLLRQDSSASASEGWWREDEEQPLVGWSPIEKSVMDAVEDYLENCAQVKVDIEVVESLLKPENIEVSPRYVLKHSTRRGNNIFQLFDTSGEAGPLCGKQKTMVGWRGKRETVHGKRDGKTSGMILSIMELWQKPHRAPTEPYKTPLPQQSSPSAREEEGRWVLMVDRRRRSIAFEKLAKQMLRYLDNSDDVKVGI